MIQCIDCGAVLISFNQVEKSDDFVHFVAVCTNCGSEKDHVLGAAYDIQVFQLRKSGFSEVELDARKLRCRRLVNQQSEESNGATSPLS